MADADETVGEDLEEKSLEDTPHRQGHRLDAVLGGEAVPLARREPRRTEAPLSFDPARHLPVANFSQGFRTQCGRASHRDP